MNRVACVFALQIVLSCLSLAAQETEQTPPNVILFMTDDMGMECLRCYGGETYETPNLDRLANEGMKFTNCFSQPLCTPSRVKIMTGRYNFRNYQQFKFLNPEERTIGHLAQQSDYATGVCGKWQLDGDPSDDFSTKFGFDSYCLWYLNQDNFGPRYANPKLVQNGTTIVAEGKYGPDIANRFALNFIDENKQGPFLLYYPMILPHFPFEPTPDSKEWNPEQKLPKPKNAAEKKQRDQKFFSDMVAYADKLVGKVVSKVDELGLTDNTIILFTSDNGTMRGLTSRWQGLMYAGGKGFLNNRGTHVPLIARWPGKIKPAQESRSLVDFTDFFSTIADITGSSIANLGEDHSVDGHSFLPILQGDDEPSRKYAYCHYEPKWGTPETGQWARNEKYKIYGGGRIYDLENDYFEESPLKPGDVEDPEQLVFLSSVLETMKAEGSRPPEKLKRHPTMNELNPPVLIRKLRPDDQTARPNIILVMADDQGYGDAGFTGHPKLKTPNMDAMAANAIVFNRFYAAAPVCSPTRASVMTGRSPIRVNVPNHGHYMRPQETTIAEALKASGYTTGHFGKWHIGSVQAESPTSPSGAGFDEWLSGLNFFDCDPFLSRNGTFEQVEGQGSVIAMDATLEFLARHKDATSPMFAVTWFPAPHDPHQETPVDLPTASEPYEGEHTGYYQEIQLIDQQLGRLRSKLRELEIAENTIVLYCSDNGGLVQKHSGGRAKKGSVYEGGLRVPAILEWPEKLKASRIDVPVFACDIYPTILHIANVQVDNQTPLDGVDLMPLIKGETETRPAMGFWHLYTGGQSTWSDKIIKKLYEAQQAGAPNPFPDRVLKNVAEFPANADGPLNGHAAINQWPWKIHRIEKNGKARVELYHLIDDPMETNDLSAVEVERTETMLGELELWQRGVLKSFAGADYDQAPE
jgi:arylsulfatase A-like enzyme